MAKQRKSNQDALLELYDKLVSGGDAEDIVRLAHERLGNPLIAADKSGRIIFAGGISESGENAALAAMAQTGYYPVEYISAMENDEEYRRAYTAPAPVESEDKFIKCRCLTFRLSCGNTVSGFAQLVELSRPITAEDTKFFAAFCKTAGTALCGRVKAQSEKQSYEYVIGEILNGNLKGDKLGRRLLSVGIERKCPRCLFVIEKNSGEKMYTGYIRRSVESIIRRCRCAVYNERLLVLVELKGNGFLKPEDRAKFKNFLQENDLSCGGSTRFGTMNELPEAYSQALTAKNIGRQMKGRGPIYYLWEYTTYQLCDMVSDKCDLMRFCNPLLIAIRAYDEANHTQFLNTLRVYLSEGRNNVRTAERMGVHRNTIDYRLGRLRELFDLNTNDANMMFSFEQSFQIIYYIEKNVAGGEG